MPSIGCLWLFRSHVAWGVGMFGQDWITQTCVVDEGTNRIFTDVVVSVHTENNKFSSVHPDGELS